MKKFALIAIAVSGVVFAQASNTIATFADPSNNGSQPLFVFNTVTNQLTGSWTGTGLTLQTPGLGGGSVADAKFAMDPVAFTPVGSNFFAGGNGAIRFYTNDINNPFLVVNFTGASLFNPISFGATEFFGTGTVNFVGAGVPAGLTQEQFAFSFANPAIAGNQVTYTASFTSSAVPEPATMTALALGAAALLRRRKKG